MSFLYSVFKVFKPVAYISLPVILVRSVAASSPVGRYYVRLGMYLGCLTAIATWGAVVAATMSLVGHRYDVNWVIARTFYAVAGRVLDIRVEVEGEEHMNTRPAVYMCNHQSMLDILFVGRMIPKRTSMMSKKSLQFTPLGPFMIMSGAIFIDRGNNARAVRSLEAAGELMKRERVSLWMYPEGTRHLSEVPDMLPLKKGGFHLAIQAGIPVVPVVTENYWRIYRQGIFGTGVVKIRVLPPVSTDGLSAKDVPELAARVRNQMVDNLREISVKVKTAGSVEEPRDSSAPPNPQESQGAPSPSSSAAPNGSNEDHSLPSDIQTIQPLEDRTHSSASIASSSDSYGAIPSSRESRSEPSENGTETEEDEGMVLVGRPA